MNGIDFDEKPGASFDELIAAVKHLAGEVTGLRKEYSHKSASRAYGFTLTLPPTNGVNTAPTAVALLPLDIRRTRALILGASAAGVVYGSDSDVSAGNGLPIFTLAQAGVIELKTASEVFVGNTTAGPLTVSVWVEID